MQEPSPILTIYHQGVAVSFCRADASSGSWFGGPIEHTLTGKRCGPQPLHQVARISREHLALLGPLDMATDVPLIYGFCYDGCGLKYRFGPAEVDLEYIQPSVSSSDWPYPSYPAVLARIHLNPHHARHETWAELGTRFPALSGGIEPDDIVIVVPPLSEKGVSLWGEAGDAEGATVLFRCNPRQSSVVAGNVCG